MKKKLLLLLSLSLTFTTVLSQKVTCDCKSQLIDLNNKVQKTPAYKSNKQTYKENYASLLKQAETVESLFDCHVVLNTLLLPLNDNHSRVHSINKGATSEIKDDANQFAEFKKSALYNSYPMPNINLDSLKSVLKTKDFKDKEGVYRIENNLTVGVYELKNRYYVIVMDSETEMWRPGEIMYTFIPFGNDYLLGMGGSPSSKRLISYTERIDQGMFHYLGFKKDLQRPLYVSETLSTETYFRKEIDDDITYLKIGSFSSWYPKLGEAETFYESLKGNLMKNHLIIDLRNNGGGGDRNSDILFDIIKEYSKKNTIIVLINHRTISNAEQFAYRVRKLDNSKLMGTRSNGALAYEVKDSSHSLTCDNFLAVLTSKKHSKYLAFESQGIQPDVVLEMDRDWIEQVMEHIQKSN